MSVAPASSTCPSLLKNAKLTTLQTTQQKRVRQIEVTEATGAVLENTGIIGSICFVVRRPGCGLCREDGLTLNTLASLPDKPLRGFGLFGIVKETGVDDLGLAEFNSDYFPFPLYRDDNMVFYRTLGSRKLTFKDFNPFFRSCSTLSSFSEWRKIFSRQNRKRITSNSKGEGFIQGGLLIFDTKGRLRFSFKERTGKELPLGKILLVIEAMRKQYEE